MFDLGCLGFVLWFFFDGFVLLFFLTIRTKIGSRYSRVQTHSLLGKNYTFPNEWQPKSFPYCAPGSHLNAHLFQSTLTPFSSLLETKMLSFVLKLVRIKAISSCKNKLLEINLYRHKVSLRSLANQLSQTPKSIDFALLLCFLIFILQLIFNCIRGATVL